MLGHAASQLGRRLGEGAVGDKHDVARFLLPAPQPVAATLQNALQAVTEEAHLFVEREAQVGAQVARFRFE